jgi:aryl-alcohol dehydrogenase-like predicted oxidoreductase
MDRIELAPGYSISRVIKGSWQLAGGHGAVEETAALRDMRAYVEAGITTFDCADIYTGVETLIGRFLEANGRAIHSGELSPVQVHTKCVPDLDALTTLRAADITATVDRSLRRLGVERLDLVQLHWWDYRIQGYVDAAGWLEKSMRAGKVRQIGVTNFDAAHLREILDAGIPIASNQVQYSALDRRPGGEMQELCQERGLSLLCYGTVAGGLLSERYRGAPELATPHETRSLTKYKLIVDEFGGWETYQKLLEVLASIAQKHDVSSAMVASRYVLQRPSVAAVIIGVRNDRHLRETIGLSRFALDADDLAAIASVVAGSSGPAGPVYGLERVTDGAHAAIMKYNLNREGPSR